MHNDITISTCDFCGSLTEFDAMEFYLPTCVLGLCEICGNGRTMGDTTGNFATVGVKIRKCEEKDIL